VRIAEGFIKLLQKLGFNSTKLQWRLYQMEQRREQQEDRNDRGETESRLPQSLRWMNYPHKFCLRCNALNDRDDKTCHKCGKRLLSMPAYRAFRVLGVLLPQTGTPVIFTFMTVIVIVYLLGILHDGASGILAPSPRTTAMFGAYYTKYTFDPYNIWRLLGFGLVHGGLIHIGFNLICQMQIGPAVEANIGRARMLVVITFTQLTSALATYIWYVKIQGHDMSTVGASGYLFGLIGFGIAYFSGAGSASGSSYRSMLIQWAVYAFVIGLFIGANNAAHAGGFIGGYLIGSIPLDTSRQAQSSHRVWLGLAGISALMWLVTLGFMILTVIAMWSAPVS
jgi:rhomboid protease GluP